MCLGTFKAAQTDGAFVVLVLVLCAHAWTVPVFPDAISDVLDARVATRASSTMCVPEKKRRAKK